MAKLPGAIQGARIVGEQYVSSRRRTNPEGRMPLFDHLRELRNRIVKMALALIAGMIVGFIVFDWAWSIISRPLCDAVIRGHTGCATAGVNQLVLNGPLDAFYLRVKVAFIVGIKVVDSLDEAIAHINEFGSHHTDAILSTSIDSINKFITGVDSASVMVNASTRFADGFEYGLGAEIGISTDKFHARGPVGLEGLTSMKWVVLGQGEVRG